MQLRHLSISSYILPGTAPLLAYIAYVILTIITILGFIRWRTMRLRKDKEKLEQEVRERTATIEEQKEEILAANYELENQKEERSKQRRIAT